MRNAHDLLEKCFLSIKIFCNSRSINDLRVIFVNFFVDFSNLARFVSSYSSESQRTALLIAPLKTSMYSS
jgi:hypothetical protein